MVIVSFLLLIVFMALLIKSSDYFVEYSSKISTKLGISEFVIGLTLVALGTSLPELMSSIFAVLMGSTDLVIGNVVGSNFANIGLILGVGGLLFAVNISKKMLIDAWIMLGATILFLILLFTNNSLSQTEGIIMVLSFVGYTFYTIGIKSLKVLSRNFIKPQEKGLRRGFLFDFSIVLVSVVGIYFGAKYTVIHAIDIATLLKVPEYIIAFTIIALGTSLPELSVTISSARTGHGSMMVGNVIGSNIANILLVGGISSIILPLALRIGTGIRISIYAMFAITIVLFLSMYFNRKLSKPTGIIFLVLYAIFIVWSIIQNFI